MKLSTHPSFSYQQTSLFVMEACVPYHFIAPPVAPPPPYITTL